MLHRSSEDNQLKPLSNIDDIDIDEVARLIEGLIPQNVCNRYHLLPLSINDATLIVGLSDPENLYAIEELEHIARYKRISLRFCAMSIGEYKQLTNLLASRQFLSLKKDSEKTEKTIFSSFQNLCNLDSDLKLLNDLKPVSIIPMQDVQGEKDLGDIIKSASDAPVINLTNKILALALNNGASDIHVEPLDNSLRIRFRKDGLLYDAFELLPRSLVLPVQARFKLIANLNIAERRVAQDGRIQRLFRGRRVDFRVSVLPSRYGEKIVLRILDNTGIELGLEKIVSDRSCVDTIREMSHRSFGLLLCTGPTGSGKSTTLYSLLSERNQQSVNICTVEDPIEYSLPGITQVQILKEKGMTFANTLRAFLRQDPDIILVGETRDPETAKIAVEAALTGHLVLSTLHTNDAVGAIARLQELGIDPFMLSNFLIGVVAQRLVRRLCPECRVPYIPETSELNYFQLQPQTIYRSSGGTQPCDKCNNKGYAGRCGVFEVMPISKNLSDLISRNITITEIKQAAIASGMKTLLEYGLDLVRNGVTTLSEVKRVII